MSSITDKIEEKVRKFDRRKYMKNSDRDILINDIMSYIEALVEIKNCALNRADKYEAYAHKIENKIESSFCNKVRMFFGGASWTE